MSGSHYFGGKRFILRCSSVTASSTSNFQDLDADWDSPLLFPDKASKELLAAIPPTVVISAEFDMFITGSVFKEIVTPLYLIILIF